jgi:predicted metal-dependent hydrolase
MQFQAPTSSAKAQDVPPYTHRTRKRAKHVTLSIRDGQVFVTAPPRVHRSLIEEFVLSKTDWIMSKLRLFEGVQRLPRASAAERRLYRAQALRIVEDKIAKLNAHYGFQYNRISIRDQRTRWGSCSSRRNLNFNYRIAFLPDHLAEYLVAHELCHLAQMNHGPQFWDLVAETIPDYREMRAELGKMRM